MSHFSASLPKAQNIETAPSAPPMPLTAYGESDVGRARERNEDSFAVLPQLGLFVVADGMGGAAAGEVASRVLVREVRKAIEDGDTTWSMDTSVSSPESATRRLMAGVHRGNRRIRAMAHKDPRKRGMGTTFAGILLLCRSAMIAHVGDSRVYRLRGGELEQLTRDHSFVNELIERGLMSPEKAATSVHRNMLTRAVGVHEDVEVDAKIVDVRQGDVFLVSSDGLHGVVSDDDIASILSGETDPEKAVLDLIELANEHGGPDNITAVVVRVDATA